MGENVTNEKQQAFYLESLPHGIPVHACDYFTLNFSPNVPMQKIHLFRDGRPFEVNIINSGMI